MNYIKHNITLLLIALAFLNSCGHKHSEGDGHNHGKESSHSEGDGHHHGQEESSHSEDDGHRHGEEHHDEGLFLTKEQMETVGLEFGEFSSIKVNDFIKATGTLGLPPNAYSSVSAKSNGILKSTNKYVEGNFIKKGVVIGYIENPDFIKAQQEYLETMAQLKLKRLDVERQRTLVDANAGVAKNLQNAEAEAAVLEAKSVGLSKQLDYLGISTTNLSPSSIQQEIAILSPMSGYISKINFHNGMYAQSSISLMEIVSTQHLHLELDVFEKDISKVKKEQKISYSIPALGQTIYQGEVSVIAKEFNPNAKTIRIHGHLEGAKPTFIKDLFVNAKIWLNDITTTALPENAIIRDGENVFIYVAKNEENATELQFEKVSIITASTDNGFTAVKLIDEIPEGMQIVTQGAYYVYAQSKAGELEHEH